MRSVAAAFALSSRPSRSLRPARFCALAVKATGSTTKPLISSFRRSLNQVAPSTSRSSSSDCVTPISQPREVSGLIAALPMKVGENRPPDENPKRSKKVGAFWPVA